MIGMHILALKRPASLNALDTAMRVAVCSTLRRLGADRSVAAIVRTGAGERAFCAVEDVRESQALGRDDGPEWMQSWTAVSPPSHRPSATRWG